MGWAGAIEAPSRGRPEMGLCACVAGHTIMQSTMVYSLINNNMLIIFVSTRGRVLFHPESTKIAINRAISFMRDTCTCRRPSKKMKHESSRNTAPGTVRHAASPGCTGHPYTPKHLPRASHQCG